MRRNLAQRFVSGQDICIFCAFRPLHSNTVRPSGGHGISREYTRSAVASRPANATAARPRDEDDEDDAPLLRQNADLLNAFPVRRKPIASQNPPPNQKQSEPKFESFLPRREPETQTEPRQYQPRNNFKSFTPRARTDIPPRRNTETGLDTADTRDRFGGRPSQNHTDRQPKRFEVGGQSRSRSFNEQRPVKDGLGSGTRRFVPNQDFENEPEQQMNTPIASSKSRVSTTGPRISWTPSATFPEDQALQQQRQSTKESFQGGRRPAPRNRESGERSQRLGQSERSERGNFGERSVTLFDTEQNDPIGDDIAEGFEQSARRSIVTEDGTDGLHHRKALPEEKRKTRSSRFDYEDEDVMNTSATTLSRDRFTSTQPSKGKLRQSSFDYEMAEAEEALYGDGGRRKKKAKSKKQQAVQPTKPTINITDFMSVGQLAKALNVPIDPFIQKLEEEGFEGPRYDHILDAQTSSMLADLYGFEPIVAVGKEAVDLVAQPPPEDPSVLPPRPPIVTIMGHVDHGKTTILDYLRKSSVVASEHGGITQHIGAFSVTMPGTSRQITFLDTPGHAAFLEMRRRGANVTDIVVLVVAADDSVKPQTIEAIKHAKEANVQIIVAINKVDKQDANVERVKQDLTRHDIVVEDFGGEIQSIALSGKTGQGMAELEEAIITLADVFDYRANKDGYAEGTIIESKVTAAGRVATILVRRGTLRVGDFIVAGNTWARLRTLRDDTGQLVDEALPGMPVQVDGWRGEDPTAGLEVLQAENEDRAKEVVKYRQDQQLNLKTSLDLAAINEARSEEAEARAKVLEWEAQQEWARKSHARRPKDNAGWVELEDASAIKEVHFVVKADVAGSVEAVVAAVSAVGTNEIKANVIHSGTGQITESDIQMLATTGETCYAISFNQPIDGTMYRLAETAGIQILDHNIIYKVTDVVKEKLAEKLPPIITQKVVGEAEVGQIFEITVKKNKIKIAGCKVSNGTISRQNKVRVLRDGEVLYTGTLHSLKNVKKDVTEMRKGTECGMGFEDWEDFVEGDQIQCFEEIEEKRTLY